MGYNLNFSGWQDMRRAVADSIINQANIKANLIAQKYDTIAKTASGLVKNGLWAYGMKQNANDKKAALEAINTANAANEAAVAEGKTGLAVDPMQMLSASGGLTGDEERDYKRAQLVNGLLRYQ